MNTEYTIRKASRSELATIIDWAALEGWNPGLHDAEAFYATDPDGFFLGLLGEEPISCISAVAYNDAFGFLGFYIVKPDYRGKGYGIRIWNEALKYLAEQNVGLDGVVEQQENYKRSGFKLAYRNIRYQGVGIEDEGGAEVVSLSEVPFDLVADYDDRVFPTSRHAFLKPWLEQPDSLAVGAMASDSLQGYGVVRKCRTGYKVGPLFADDEAAAAALLQKMRVYVGEDTPVYLDVPEVNDQAIALAERSGMKPMFETARMYTREVPDVPLDRIPVE